MAYTVNINNGEFVFAVTTKFSIRDRNELRESGVTDFQETLIALEGELIGVGATQALIAADSANKFQALRALAKKLTPFRVEIFRDAVSEYVFDPALSIGTPKFRDIAQLMTGGDHATHVRFTASIYVRTPINDVQLGEFERRITSFIEEKLLVRKVWFVRAKGRTFEEAKARVTALKPRVTPLLEELIEEQDISQFTAIWTWEKKKEKDTVLGIDETIRVTPAAHPWILEPVIGIEVGPVFHKARRRAGSTEIITRIETSERKDLRSAYSPHVSESKDVKRDRTRETQQHGPVLFDFVKGRYRQTVHEFYWWTSKTEPTITHRGHAKPFEEQGTQDSALKSA